MKQLEVQIMGQSYLLGCPENGDARMLDAVNRVDMAMCRIRDAGKIKARDRIAVLAALNLAYALAGRPPARAAGADALTPAPSSGGVDLDALIARIDQALGADGQLL